MGYFWISSMYVCVICTYVQGLYYCKCMLFFFNLCTIHSTALVRGKRGRKSECVYTCTYMKDYLYYCNLYVD